MCQWNKLQLTYLTQRQERLILMYLVPNTNKKIQLLIKSSLNIFGAQFAEQMETDRWELIKVTARTSIHLKQEELMLSQASKLHKVQGDHSGCASKQKLRFSTWASYDNGTFVLMSTGGLAEPEWSPWYLALYTFFFGWDWYDIYGTRPKWLESPLSTLTSSPQLSSSSRSVSRRVIRAFSSSDASSSPKASVELGESMQKFHRAWKRYWDVNHTVSRTTLGK